MNNNIIEKIKILRSKTGISFIECKKALTESNLNIEEAINYLRKTGFINAHKRQEKTTLEGLIISKIDEKRKNSIMVEINCETDFVAKSVEFINFCDKITNYFLEKNNSKNTDIYKDEITLPEHLENEKIAVIFKFKENILIKRIKHIYSNEYEIFGYVHGTSNCGKIASIIIIKKITNDLDLIKDIAMQIVAMKPKFLDINSIPKNIIDKETNVIIENVKNNFKNKSEAHIETIAKNQLNKFYEENVLLEQNFIKDQKIKIKNIINNKFIIKDFFRFELGENF